MRSRSNPYKFSVPVYREGEFFNRQPALARLDRALHAHRSVQLVGQFRIGKSSLLHYIQARQLLDEKTIVIAYNLSRRPLPYDGDDFFARIWQMMSQALVERSRREASLSPEVDLTDPFDFEDYVDKWTNIEGYRFVFLLDEFGIISRDRTFNEDFFGNLRSMIPTFTFIVTARRSLSSFSHKGVSSSPLWNALELVRLALFEDRESVQELIRRPAERVGLTWSEEAEEFIYERGGQHPCYIQMAASALYDTHILNQGQLDYGQADRIFRETATEHFRYLWAKTLDDRDRPTREDLLRTALLDLVRGHRIDEDLAKDLERRSLVWFDEPAGQWRPLSAWFADWLRRWSTDKRRESEAGNAFSKPSRSDTTLEKGAVVDDQYVVLKTVGRTNHSQVVMAWDRELERLVAIKCLRLDQEPNYGVVQAFREKLSREGRIIAELGQPGHPNIGEVYAIIAEPLGIVMEWIEGTSLREIVDVGRQVSVVETLRIGIVLADVLCYVHSRETFHRDIKPSNIILTVSPDELLKPVLIDFDIARVPNRETISRLPDGTHAYVGTKCYSAPEQFLNPKGVGSPTDLFALGLVLYEMLTGELPYEYGNRPSLYCGGHLPQPRQFRIPGPLYTVLCSLLSEEPHQRPDAARLKKDLENCLDLIQSR